MRVVTRLGPAGGSGSVQKGQGADGLHAKAEHRRRRTLGGRSWDYIDFVRTARTVLLVALSAACGVLVGMWMASMTYPCLLCAYAAPKYATWQSCLVGAVTAALTVVIASTLDGEFLEESARGIRTTSRFLFEDLSRRQVP